MAKVVDNEIGSVSPLSLTSGVATAMWSLMLQSLFDEDASKPETFKRYLSKVLIMLQQMRRFIDSITEVQLLPDQYDDSQRYQASVSQIAEHEELDRLNDAPNLEQLNIVLENLIAQVNAYQTKLPANLTEAVQQIKTLTSSLITSVKQLLPALVPNQVSSRTALVCTPAPSAPPLLFDEDVPCAIELEQQRRANAATPDPEYNYS